MDVLNLKAYEIREKVSNKELTAREVVEAFLGRIEEVEDDIKAFITIDKEGALSQADEIDKKIKNNEEVGALAGIPIGIKDNIVTKDLRTTCGSRMLENYISPFDATVVQKIKEQDGIIIGKTNMDEFAMGTSSNTSYFGVTKNPTNPNFIPGGSSGGSAAAVAANLVPLSLGTDTGGSNTQPASFCGVVGIKPSYGLVSRNGLITVANTLDTIGVLGKDVKDAALLLQAISGYDKNDPTTINKEYENFEIKTTKSNELVQGMKVGIPKEIYEMELDPKIQEEFEKVIELFKSNGAIVEDISLPNLKYATETYIIISNGEAASNMARFDGLRYGYRAKGYENLDELYIKSRTESLGNEVKKRIILGTYLVSSANSKEYYNKALRVRTLIKNDFDRAFEDYDIILTPTAPILPFELNKKLSYEEEAKINAFTTPVNLAGLCVLNIPTNPGDEIPVGLQIIGGRFKETNIIKAGLAFEGMVK